MSLELHVHSRIDEVDPAAWNALWRPADTPFVEHRFLHGFEETGCVGEGTGWMPHHLTLHDQGRLIAAAPAYVKFNSEGEFVFDWGWADAAHRAGIDYYPKLIVAVPFTPATGARVLIAPDQDRPTILRLFARALMQLFNAENALSSMHILFTEDELTRPFLDAGFGLRFGVQYHFRNEGRCADSHTDTEHRHGRPPGLRSFEDFLTTLPSKRRTQIRRERRSIGEQGFTVRTLRADELTPEIARVAYELYLTTVDKFAWGRRYLNADFFAYLARELPERQRWVVAEREGRIVAGAINLIGEGVLYGRYWGAFEEHPFLHFATCYYHGVDECIRDGLHTFEPGAGGEHKRPRGFVPTKTRSLHVLRNPHLAHAVDDFLARERSAIERLLAEHAEQR